MKKNQLSKFFLLISLALSLRPLEAYGCATCMCGDPTLTAMGAEKPFENRLRLSLDLRYRTDRIGEKGVDQIELKEYRQDAQIAWAPSENIFLMATLPVVQRTISYVSERKTKISGLGDIELLAKFFLYKSPGISNRHLVAILPGIKAPTAKTEYDDQGRRLPIEAQPGTGSWDPMLGLSYGYFAHPWSFYLSATGSTSLHSKSDFRASPSLRTTLRLQRQIGTLFAARLGTDTRSDGRSYEDGKAERDSGGFIAFTSGEMLLSPTTDLVLVASASIPTVQNLSGYHREGNVFSISAVYDL